MSEIQTGTKSFIHNETYVYVGYTDIGNAYHHCFSLVAYKNGFKTVDTPSLYTAGSTQEGAIKNIVDMFASNNDSLHISINSQTEPFSV